MRARVVGAGLLSLVLVAACGGGGAAPTGQSGPTAGAGGGGATSAPPSQSSMTDVPATDAPGEITAQPIDLPDPCPVVTQEEAATAVGGPVGAGVEDQLTSDPVLDIGRVCMFAGANDGEVRIELHHDPGDLWEPYKLQQSQFGSVTDLAAGDRAFTVGNYQCNVVAGDVMMVLSLTPADYDTDPEPRMIELCRQAAARL